MKKLLLVLLILGVTMPAVVSAAPLVFREDFNFTGLLTANGWAAHSGAGTNAISASSPALYYTGYPSQDIGNSASMTTSGEDDNKTFTSVSSGSVYYAFLVNFSAAQATGDYFILLGGATIGTNYYARVYAKLLSGAVSLGVNRQNGTPIAYTTGTYALNTTHLIVVKYTFVSGTLNDTADLFVDPTVGGSEPAPTLTSTDAASVDASVLGSIALRQGAAGGASTQRVDGIRVGTTWADVVNGTGFGACCNPTTGVCILAETSLCATPNVWHGEWTACDPNPCPQPQGACCAPDGSCAVTAQASCVAPSVWHSDWAACSPNPCPQPTGACCAPDGSCAISVQASCASPSVWHSEWTACSPNPCPQPQGACCQTNGTCTFVTLAECAYTWLGYGSACDPNPCQAQLGACCAPDGSCTVTGELACVTPSIWHSEFTACLPANPCPQPAGACCHPDGSCTDLTQAACADTWEGYLTSCATFQCPQPPGACCDGTTGACTYVTAANCSGNWLGYGTTCSPNPCPQPGACCVNSSCLVQMQAACEASGGTWKGANTACSPWPCPAVPMSICEVRQNDINGVPVNLGKVVTVQGTALAASGEFSATPQIPITDGNCCTTFYGTFTGWPAIARGDLVSVTATVTNYSGLEELQNPQLNFTVISSGSLPTPYAVTTNELATNGEQYESCYIKLSCVHIVSGTWPVTGAAANIVVDDGSGPVTMRINSATDIDGSTAPTGNFDIIGTGNQFDSTSPYTSGYQIFPRALSDLVWGACCQHDGTCSIKCPNECAAVGGILHTDVKSCSPNPCPLPMGACCDPSTGACNVTTQANCAAPLSWQGIDTACEPVNPCSLPLGACCHPDGSCTVVYQHDCNDPNVWQGANTTCGERNPCPQAQGACCHPDGICTSLLQVDCLAPNTWRGPLTTCDPNLCPQPTGACCAPDGGCQVTLQVECATPAVWHPEWLLCDPNPCPIPMGACCRANGGCTETPQGACYAPDTWMSGLTCTPNPCAQPNGACCAPDGTCSLIQQAACVAPSTWNGGTSCQPNPCPQPPAEGACCATDGGCTVTQEAACASPSIWHSESTTCTPNPCPQLGACCNASTGACILVLQTACTAPLNWNGIAVCSPNPCPQPLQGACCLNNGAVCAIASAASCAAQSGTYKGDNTTCAPVNPCTPPVPVEHKTWGQIKHQYH